MDAWLATLAVVGLMVLALVLLGRTWPRSSRAGGYRAGRGAGHTPGTDAAAEPPAPEDDDVHWNWHEGDTDGDERP
jgi:hypothetical protein